MAIALLLLNTLLKEQRKGDEPPTVHYSLPQVFPPTSPDLRNRKISVAEGMKPTLQNLSPNC